MRNSHDQLHVGGKICNGVAACLAVACLSFHSNAGAQSAESRAVLQPSPGAVSLDRLRRADQEPGQWMTTGRDQSAAFFSPLKQIDKSTASRLGFAWQFKTDTYRGMEATPLVVDGVLYVSGTWGSVYAIDGATGVRKWAFDPHNDPSFDASSARWSGDDVTTRGLTIWQGKVFAVSTDCKLYALDARDGHIVWQRETLAEKLPGYACSGAPQIAGRVVVVGNAGGDNLAGGVGNVRVNAIAPGLIQTDLSKSMWQTDDAARAIKQFVRQGRIGQPRDIGGAAVFLASDAASFIQGETLVVDGGFVAR
jgi:glucose dehydrogenase